jgi:hypothetical protein
MFFTAADFRQSNDPGKTELHQTRNSTTASTCHPHPGGNGAAKKPGAA